MENENTGAWFNKINWKDMRLIMNENELPPEGFVKAEPLFGVDYQIYDEGLGAWIADPNAEALARIDACKAELAEIDREAGAGRAVRGIALAAADNAGMGGDDYNRLQGYESRAVQLRETIAALNRQINGRN